MAAWAIPLLLLGVGLPLSYFLDDRALEEPMPQAVLVGSRTFDGRTSVQVEVSYSTPWLIRTSAAGTVTGSYLEPGEVVVQGTRLIDIDFQPVLALVSASPLVRDLSLGASGPDVGLLAKFLSETGYLAKGDISSDFGWSMRQAVTSFQDSIGTEADGVFRLAYVAYIPAGAETVADASLRVGDPFDFSSTIYESAAPVQSVRITPTSPTSSLDPLASAPVQLLSGGGSLALSSLVPGPEELADLDEFLRESVAKLDLTREELSSGSVVFSGGFLALSTPVVVGSVAASAVWIGGDDVQCVFQKTEDGIRVERFSGASMPSGEIGVVSVPARLAGVTVIRDSAGVPRSLRDQCV